MRRKIMILLVTILSLSLVSCTNIQRINIEDQTFQLINGIDKKGNQLYFYSVAPVFSKEAIKKTEDYEEKSHTMRTSRQEFDSRVTALSIAAKLQVLLVGKGLAKEYNVYELMDVLYRDVGNGSNARVVLVDGPVKDVISFSPENRPRLPILLVKLIDAAYFRNLTQKVTLPEFQWQMTEPGITPFVSEIMLDKQGIRLKGMALLNSHGKYVNSLDLTESIMFSMLVRKKQGTYSLTVPIKKGDDKATNKYLSATYDSVRDKVKVSMRDGHFHFDIELKMDANITESINLVTRDRDYLQIKKKLEKILDKDFKILIKKLQKNKVDPIGYGLYAQAYQYKEWKKIKDRWPKEFAKATFSLKTNVRFKYPGSVQE
ncbi:Ger(x)C family spore germination protein [Brevibacillus daliensis]|uniref:Ger(x)C family spore germination protein n=1 Tax=Brevibacillus daliensis TaxID=2892995 RepID=UPI001E4D55C2|nr:Ger(x)C family spore germination protein [Brevibacillus daliensis]